MLMHVLPASFSSVLQSCCAGEDRLTKLDYDGAIKLLQLPTLETIVGDIDASLRGSSLAKVWATMLDTARVQAENSLQAFTTEKDWRNRLISELSSIAAQIYVTPAVLVLYGEDVRADIKQQKDSAAQSSEGDSPAKEHDVAPERLNQATAVAANSNVCVCVCVPGVGF